MTGASEQREVALAFNDMTDRLAQVLAAQREFVANASHQLRTPLTGLRLRLEAAGLKADDPELERELRAAEAEVERLTQLLNSLLTLAREGDRPPLRAPTSLRESCEAALSRWEAQAAQSEHVLELEPGPDVAVRAAEDDVAIILDNLLENALVYSPGGTVVTLGWDASGRLAVADEGPGLEPGEERQVFERFHRGRRDRPGTGLGLAIVETLARRWGGTASIRNRSGWRSRGRGRAAGRAGPGPRGGTPMTRTVLLGTLGLVLAVATGLAVHLLTRETIALPVVSLEQDAGLAPVRATTAGRTTTVRVTTTAPARTTTAPAGPAPASPVPAGPAPAATTDDEPEAEATARPRRRTTPAPARTTRGGVAGGVAAATTARTIERCRSLSGEEVRPPAPS